MTNRASERLQELLNKGLTQQAIADAAGVTQPAVSRWLQGSRPELAARRAVERLAKKHRVSIPIDLWDEAVDEPAERPTGT